MLSLSNYYEGRLCAFKIFFKAAVIHSVMLTGLFQTMSAQDYKPRNYIPPSPIAASFKIYGDIPVSFSTGVPDITIPIYVIEAGNYKIPITLKYHVKSIKPGSAKSNVALGWTLDYGGMVSRSIYDRPDDGLIVNYSGTNFCGSDSNQELMDMQKINGSDSEFDIYNFSIPGHGGEFIVNNNTPVLLSNKPLRINFAPNDIDLTDDRGTKYKFGYGKYHLAANSANFLKSSWLLSQIALPTNHTIDFIYQDISRFRYYPNSRMLSISGDKQNRIAQGIVVATQLDPIPPANPYISFPSPSYIDYDEKNISEINFPNGKIVFSLSADKKIITGLKIYNTTELLKEYQFVLSETFGTGDMKLLNKVISKDNTSSDIETYELEYYAPTTIASDAGTDYWGYYNGASKRAFPCDTYTYDVIANYDNSAPTPWTLANLDVTSYCQNKMANLTFSTQNALWKIKYPTKGESEFIYGLNQVYSTETSAVVLGNGLRLEKLNSLDGTGTLTTKTFTYETPSSSTLPLQKSEFASISHRVSICDDIFSPSTVDQFIAKTTNFTYDADFSSRIASSLMDIRYEKVTETVGTTSLNIGRNVYYYKSNHHEIAYPYNMGYGTQEGPRYALSKYRGWDSDLLIRKETYAKDETIPIETHDYKYNYHYTGSFQNTYVRKLTDYPNTSNWGLNESATRQMLIGYGVPISYLPHVFSYYKYEIVSGWTELEEEISLKNMNGALVETKYKYKYDGAKTFYPSSISTSDSRNSYKTQVMQYPYDFPTVQPYSAMLEKNIISPAISTIERLGEGVAGQVISTKRINYFNWGNNIFQPSSIEVSTLANAPEPRLTIHAYDSFGNPLSLSADRGPKTTYKWSYNKQYPIAEAKNASLNEFYHQNFEDGEVDYDGSLMYDNTKAHTGKYSGRLTNPNASEMVSHSTKRIAINQGVKRKFTFSGWVYSDAPTVELFLFMMKPGETAYNSYYDNMQTTVKNKWTYMQKDFEVPADVYEVFLRLDNNSFGNVWFDDLRIQPSDASMNTYTYSPLVGMTSAIDDSGKTVYYEYDSFQRLKSIKDQNRNIVKTYDYHFKQ